MTRIGLPATEQVQGHVEDLIGEIRSVTLHTLTNAPSLEMAALALDGRLAAIGRAHSSLISGKGRTDLEALIGEELRAAGIREGASTIVSGPELALEPKAATSVTLGIHELATSSPNAGRGTHLPGALNVSWAVTVLEGRRWLQITWQEGRSRGLCGGEDQEEDRCSNLAQTLAHRPQLSVSVSHPENEFACTIATPLA